MSAPIVCRPWCNDRSGHGDEGAEDQRCETAPVRIGQSLVPMWAGVDGTWSEQVLDARVIAGPSFPPQVRLWIYGEYGQNDLDYEIRLTPREARDLAQHLNNLAALAAGEYDPEPEVR